MTFTDMTNIPLHQIDTTVEVIRKGDGSHDGDDVVVTSTLEITADIAGEEAVLLLPLAASAQFKPIVRYTQATTSSRAPSTSTTSTAPSSTKP